MQTIIGYNLEYAAELLRNNELVAIPTETVYGLAGNALNSDAVTRIFEAKNRPHFNPLIVHLASLDQAESFVAEIPEQARKLAKHFMPGPLTLLLPRLPAVPDLVTAGSDFVAIRIPAHPVAIRLLQMLEFPLAAPSANPFGYISPTSAEHVLQQLSGKIPYILDGGLSHVGVESTIVGFSNGIPRLLRPGGVGREAIEAIIGEPLQDPEPNSNLKPVAPGMLETHYAPHTRFVLGNADELIKVYAGKKIGLLAFNKGREKVSSEDTFILSPSGTDTEAARNLFAYMRRLDEAGYEIIIAEPVPATGLGPAINDRLRRAAANR
ncbi:MAG: L-threonylcarbamoyladenylate synthase [Bacteroidota bacterium]